MAPIGRTILSLALALWTAAPLAAQSERARATLAKLSPRERAAQLMMSWSLTRGDAGYPLRDTLRRQVEEVGIGGVILSIGEAADAPGLIDDLQRRAKLPLLCAGDFETGVSFRLRHSTEFGPAMLLGATDSPALARAAGRLTGIEALALGFHQVFGPVLDVNVNPANPVIGVRSFGEDPARVGALGAAFIAGLHDAGVFATGKHFPGHGDVSVDSHLAMPTVPGDRARLDAVELAPFRVAIAAGVDSIMTGHLSVPGLGEDPAVPATLSHRILSGLLREQLGFQGVIVTDALEMKGLPVDSQVDLGVRALAAGADLLLMPLDPGATCDAIVAAIASGRLTSARLDEACLRILELKVRAGLLDGRGRALPDAMDHVATAEATALAARIAARGLTLLRDPHGVVPFAGRELAIVEFVDSRIDEAGGSFRSGLADASPRFAGLRLENPPDPQAVADAARLLQQVRSRGGLAVLALRTRKPMLPAALQPIVDALGDDGVGVLFGNPYLAATLPPACAVLLAYGTSEATATAAARALRGDGDAVGRLPVTLPGVATRGDGISLYARERALRRESPTDHGLASNLPSRLRKRLEQALADHVAPGAVALIARHGVVVAEAAVGRETYADDAPAMTMQSRFDLASLTKVCATTPALLRLIDRGELALDTPVQRVLPDFVGTDKDKVTVRHLLTHSSGLPPFSRFYRDHHGKDAIVAAALATPLSFPPGTETRYSDIGMILAMAVVEAVSGEDFDVFTVREIFTPLGMDGARFNRSGRPIDAVPTENDAWRGRVVRGEVHDENAFAMGGVSGHAGLFARAGDVARLGLAFLGGGRGVLNPATARLATRRQAVVDGSTRALGWDTFVEGGSGGSKLSPHAFGHTGFTGTSIWCDPDRDLVIVLLTNRVHPTRENNGHIPLRRDIADLVVDALDPTR